MGYASNREPRRRWREDAHRVRVPCASCGAPARPHSLPFCNTCLDWAHHNHLAETGELDTGD
jgi:hypothetical protein